MEKLMKLCDKHPGMTFCICETVTGDGYSIAVHDKKTTYFEQAIVKGKDPEKKARKVLKKMAKDLEVRLERLASSADPKIAARCGKGKKAPMSDKCANCGADISTADRGEIQFIERGEDKSRHLVSKVLVCKDCLEKAEVAVADWADLPDWL